MTQHFHNTFIILLYFILTCKELTVQQFRKYCDDNKMSKYFHTKKKKKNVMSMTFSQQIISNRLLLIVIGGQKSNFIGKFKLEPITIYHK